MIIHLIFRNFIILVIITIIIITTNISIIRLPRNTGIIIIIITIGIIITFTIFTNIATILKIIINIRIHSLHYPFPPLTIFRVSGQDHLPSGKCG